MRAYTNSEMAALIDEHIHSVKCRRILKLRYLDGMTYEEIAADGAVELSPRRVAAIVSRESPRLDNLLREKSS